MADPALPPNTDRPPDFRISVQQSVAGLVDAGGFAQGAKWLGAALLEWAGDAIGLILTSAAWIAGTLATALVKGEDKAQGAFGELAAVAVKDVFGVDVDAAAMNARGDRGRRTDAANAIGRAVLESLTKGGDGASGGGLSPSSAGAENYLTVVTQMAIEGWLEGWLVEALTLGQLETFGELDDIMAQVLGLGRMSRAVVRPLLEARVITPFRWQVDKTYRPNLLSAGEVARQVARGRWSKDQAIEELARQGWSDDRIEALLNAAAKFHSAADLALLVNSGLATSEQALTHMRAAGFDEDTARTELQLEELKDIAAFERSMANAAVDAFADGRISSTQLDEFTRGVTFGEKGGARLRELAAARRALRARQLSSSQAEQMVKSGVLAVQDYRAALTREGYTTEAITALELQLRWELNKQKAVEDHRRELEAEREAERQRKAAAAAAKLADVEAERALQRRGSISDLKRAAVRGLIPFSRLEEVLRAEYDDDTVQILLADVEIDRQTYLAQQQRAAAVKQSAARRGLSIGDVEQAVLANVLTLDDYRKRLAEMGIADDDAGVLVATLTATLDDRRRATATRDDAGGKAAARSIDLSRFEQLVRRGVRTMAQYDALLASLGYDDAARADMGELLALKIADDEAAAGVRDENRGERDSSGLSLDEWRRAVILGLKTTDQFAAMLIQEGYTSDEQALLLAELRDDVAEADAARTRRETSGAAVEGKALALSTVQRAARLGIISPDVYEQRLVAAGYTDDDIAIELQLLLTEIADVQAARATSEAVDRDVPAKDLGLADLARAVRRGLDTLDNYRARALQLGLTPAAADTLTRVLADELRETTAAKERREEIATELSSRNLSLAQLEEPVRSGAWTIADFVAALEETGYTAADAELLGFVLADDISGAAPGAA